MTMLTPTRGPFERAPYASARRETIGPGVAQAHLATIKRILVGVVTMLTAGAAVAAIMALKIAIYLPRFIHH
jgi:hypothetical protein